MYLEIVDYLNRETYKGTDGVTIITPKGVHIHALKTEQNKYVVKKNRWYEQLAIHTNIQTEEQAIIIIGDLLPSDYQDVLKDIKFEGYMRITKQTISNMTYVFDA